MDSVQASLSRKDLGSDGATRVAIRQQEGVSKKAVNAEAKAGLQPTSAGQPAARAQTHGPLMKDPWVEDTKFKPQKPKSTAPQPADNAETSEKARKENKKR